MKSKKDHQAVSKQQTNILIVIVILFSFLIATGVFLSKNLKGTYSAETQQCFECKVRTTDGGYRTEFTRAANSTSAASVIEGGYDCQTVIDAYCDAKCYACKIGVGYEYITATGDPVSVIPNATSCQEAASSICSDPPEQCYECRENGVTTYVWADDHCEACGENSTNYTIVESSKCGNNQCYVCKTNSNIMKWGNNGNGDSNCSGGYEATTTPEASCVTTSACYRCTANNNIMKWSTNGNADDSCPGGYEKTTTPQSSCVTNGSCYRCKTDSTIMKWSTNGNADSNCSSGYEVTTTPQSSCVTTSCYRCTANNTIMKWGTNGDADSNCPGGYEKTTTPQSSCVTTSSCYRCIDDNSIMKWGTNGTADNSCPGGYEKVNNPASECPPPQNPKTGTAGIIIAWIVAVLAISYAIFYMIRINKLK